MKHQTIAVVDIGLQGESQGICQNPHQALKKVEYGA